MSFTDSLSRAYDLIFKLKYYKTRRNLNADYFKIHVIKHKHTGYTFVVSYTDDNTLPVEFLQYHTYMEAIIFRFPVINNTYIQAVNYFLNRFSIANNITKYSFELIPRYDNYCLVSKYDNNQKCMLGYTTTHSPLQLNKDGKLLCVLESLPGITPVIINSNPISLLEVI